MPAANSGITNMPVTNPPIWAHQATLVRWSAWAVNTWSNCTRNQNPNTIRAVSSITVMKKKMTSTLTKAAGYDAEGAYSRDGKQIAFCSTRDGDPDIYVMNADGGEVRQLTDAPRYDGGPFISPDGRWVVFRSDRKEKELLQIYVIGIDGKQETALTDNNGVNWGPYWHPSQPYIIWAGADHSVPGARPNYDLWLMRYEVADGKLTPGKVTRITDHPSADVLPVFSPDGKRLMWTSKRTKDHTSQLWIAEFHLPD